MLISGQAITQAMSLLRNIIIARLLTPEDMGIAATFAITITLLEMISNLAVDMLLIQAKDGDDPVFQGTAHSYQVFRGLMVGLIIFGCSPLIVWLFKIPQAEWAFHLVSLVPVLRGFMHLDWKRLQRKMQYRTAVLVEVIPQAVVTLVAYPVVIWFGDYSAVLWIVLAQSVVALLTSHVFAQRSYHLDWERKYAMRLLVFGWPLLINGLLMFGALQGDRLIIGTFYSMTDLGIYSVAFTFALMLASIVAKISTSLFLPLLARLQDQHTELKNCYIITGQTLALIGGVVALPFITTGGNLITFIFGKQYLAAFVFAPWLGALLAARIFRLAPIIAALACGDTKNSMYANLFRLTGVVAAVLVAWQNLSLSAIIICGIIGEVLALLFSTLRLQRLHRIRIIDSLYAPLVVSAVLLLAGVNSRFSFFWAWLNGAIGSCLFFYFILLCVGVVAFPMLRINGKKKI